LDAGTFETGDRAAPPEHNCNAGAGISLLELAEILDQHKTWVESGGENGERADLSGVNLSNADLTGVNLQGAVLKRSNLSGADLSMANLRGANLMQADLCNANLLGTELRGTDLMGAVLYGAEACGLAAWVARTFSIRCCRIRGGGGQRKIHRAGYQGCAGLLFSDALRCGSCCLLIV